MSLSVSICPRSTMDDQDVSIGVVHHLGRYRSENAIDAVVAMTSDHDEVDVDGTGDIENLSPRIAEDDQGRPKGDARDGSHPFLQLTLRVGDQLGFQAVGP